MNRLFLFLTLLAAVLLRPATGLAQTPAKPVSASALGPARRDSIPNQFKVKARNTGSAVVLRWQPNTELLWKVANQVGYRVERYTVSTDTSRAWEAKIVTLMPWRVADWQTNAPTDTLGAVMATLAFENRTAGPPGGSLGELLQLKAENDNRFFLSMLMAAYYPAQAERMGLRLTDATVKKGQKYLYKIFAPTMTQNVPSDTALLYVDTDQPDPLPTLPAVEVLPGDRTVRLRWNKTYADSRFVGYYYDRSADGGRTWYRQNRQPFAQVFANLPKEDQQYITLTDSLPANYRRYQYRLFGVTTFGELTDPSPNLPVMGRDLVPPAGIVNLKAVNTVGSAVGLTWAKPVVEGDFAGYLVGKSNSSGGPFVALTNTLLPKNQFQFTDPTANEYDKNYYVVSAIDTAGNVATSLPVYVAMADRSGPAKPTGLTGQIDSTGVVRIQWTHNAEPDLRGYLVYAANAADHPFTVLTTDYLADEFFADSITLRTLTKKIYYRVVAVDKSSRASAYSEMLELKKPDRVPPVSPVFDQFAVTDSSVTLRWVPSSSDDVEAQLLYRRDEALDQQPVVMARLDKTQTTYIDKTVLPRHWYAYTLVAEDDSRNVSRPSFPQRVRPYFSGIRPAIRQFSTALSPDKKQAVLSWTYPPAPDCRILVYRKIDTGDLTLIENLSATNQQFTDPVPANGTYQYAIKAVYKDGQATLLSAFSTVAVAR